MQSGKLQRYEEAKHKYQKFQNRKDKIEEMENIIRGKEKKKIIPKPGEFVVVCKSRNRDTEERSVGLDDLI